ncbi:hypothetical protein THRCLA_23173 [Thraustotheca clavata]|uniref:Uncharacterized protein n=1 Tax=Thraustotheca clavata TaxID=74557 RepID=A0A1V9YBX3_9STRA|nr:hypothetical protein THRCLA_23173 [Thraustotheca clavata]
MKLNHIRTFVQAFTEGLKIEIYGIEILIVLPLEQPNFRVSDISGSISDWYVGESAAEIGRLDIIKLLHENHVDGNWSKAVDIAAVRGRIDIVKYIHEIRSEGCTANTMDGAAANGKLNIVKYLYQNRTEGCTKRVSELAARNGHLA